jgi:dipeptidyl aminopeptidase/acylaminoacyl peptidase
MRGDYMTFGLVRRFAGLVASVAAAGSGVAFAQTLASAPSVPPIQITVETFAAPPFVEDPELSPNGQFYAARLSVGGHQLLGIMSLYDKAINPVMVGLDDDKIAVDSWEWVNDDWLLLHLSANDGIEGEKIRVYRIVSLNRKTGEIKPLVYKDSAQNAADVIWIAKDGSPRILVGVQNSIYSNFEEFWPEVREVDVSTGKTKIATKRRLQIMDYAADASGAVRLGYGYDPQSRTQKMIYRSTGKGSFHTADRANLSKDEDLLSPSLLLAAPDKAVTIDRPNNFYSLYALDLATMQRGEKLFGLDRFDIGGVVSNAAGDAVAGVYTIENRSRIAWIDAGLKQTQADLDKAVGASNAQIVSWDRAMQKLLVKVGAPNQVGSYFLFDRAGAGKMTRIAYGDETLKMRQMGAVSSISYKARDGLTVPAVLTLPQGKPAKGLPLILLPHGGPGARDYERWDWIAQFFAWRGYAVVQPNYRGSTGFGKDHYDKGDGEWGLKMQDDLNDAVSHLAGQGIIDPKRVCIVGGSYGGYAAMRGAQRDGDKFRCAISFAGVSDMPSMSRYDGRFLYGTEYRSNLKKKAPDLAAVSPLRFPEQFSTPILLIHGKLDLTVPVEQSRKMADKLKAAGKTYRYVEQPLADHHFSRKEDRLQFLQEVDAFLAKHNPADAAAKP